MKVPAEQMLKLSLVLFRDAVEPPVGDGCRVYAQSGGHVPG